MTRPCAGVDGREKSGNVLEFGLRVSSQRLVNLASTPTQKWRGGMGFALTACCYP